VVKVQLAAVEVVLATVLLPLQELVFLAAQAVAVETEHQEQQVVVLVHLVKVLLEVVPLLVQSTLLAVAVVPPLLAPLVVPTQALTELEELVFL